MIADVKLSEFPEIMDLLKILEENGLFKQVDEVSTLVHYVEHITYGYLLLNELNQGFHSCHNEGQFVIIAN